MKPDPTREHIYCAVQLKFGRNPPFILLAAFLRVAEPTINRMEKYSRGDMARIGFSDYMSQFYEEYFAWLEANNPD